MENTSFQEPYPSKPGGQAPPYNPGPPVMQPSPYPAYYPDHGVQQTVISQPASTNMVVNRQMASTQPQYNDYICWSVLSILCCCPLGFAAIIFSCKTINDIENCDHDSAARNSRTAFRLNIWALVAGIIIGIIAAIYFLFLKPEGM